MDKTKPFGRVFFKISLINLRFAQMQGCVFVQRSVALVFSNVIRQLTLSRLISPKKWLVILLLSFVRFIAQRAHIERLVSLKKRDIKLYVVCHTAKAYFPDRQSCSTLCRQPFGCAPSVEVVAVYPSLGSYSVVDYIRRASPPFRRLLILSSIYKGMGKVKSKPEIRFF